VALCCSLIPSSWSGVEALPTLAAVVIAVYASSGVGVWGHQQKGQPSDSFTEDCYDVR
jgi:hypothetical protein